MLATYYAENAKGKALSEASAGCEVANPAEITKDSVQPMQLTPHQTHLLREMQWDLTKRIAICGSVLCLLYKESIFRLLFCIRILVDIGV